MDRAKIYKLLITDGGNHMSQENQTNKIKEQLEKAGYDNATAVATKAEIEAGAACGQLSIIASEKETEG